MRTSPLKALRFLISLTTKWAALAFVRCKDHRDLIAPFSIYIPGLKSPVMQKISLTNFASSSMAIADSWAEREAFSSARASSRTMLTFTTIRRFFTTPSERLFSGTAKYNQMAHSHKEIER